MQPLLLAVALLATPDFPDAIARDLSLKSAPRCTICHATDSGGAGTVVRPFGTYLVSRGLRPFDESSLHNALLAAGGERHSSNAQGVLDLDALAQGQDPNGVGGSGGMDLTPTYGCASGGSGNALAVLAGFLWLLIRRRSRSTPA